MTKFGIILGSLSIFMMIAFLALGIVLKKLLSNNKKIQIIVNVILSIIGLFSLFWFVFLRYISDFKNLLNFANSIDNQIRSIYYSKVLLLDLCPFAYVILSFFMIFDFKRKYINIVAIWAWIGSIITIFGSVWTTNFPINQWYKYIFIGSSEGSLYFWIHIFMLLFGAFFIGYTNRINMIRCLSMHISVSIYLIYVIIIVKTLNIIRNATGLVEFDWVNELGEYHDVYLFFNIPYIGILFLSYFLVWLGLMFIIGLKNVFSYPEKEVFFPKIIYKKFILIKNISNRIYEIKFKIWTNLKLIRLN